MNRERPSCRLNGSNFQLRGACVFGDRVRIQAVFREVIQRPMQRMRLQRMHEQNRREHPPQRIQRGPGRGACAVLSGYLVRWGGGLFQEGSDACKAKGQGQVGVGIRELHDAGCQDQ